MKRGAKILACALAGAGLCQAARADVEKSTDNPYAAIMDRNVFGLKPPPPPPPPPEEPKPPPPNVNITGITTLGGVKRAMLKIPASPAKPGQPAKPDQYFTLGEGDRDGELEVVQIDAIANTVRMNISGALSTLDFTNNGVKLAAGPAPAAPGGAPGVSGISLPGTAGSVPGLPVRTLRLPTPRGSSIQARPLNSFGAASSSMGVQPGYGYSAGANSSLQVGIPSSSSAGESSQAAMNPVHQLPVEHQVIMIEAERQRTQPAVAAGLMPPLPPTPITQMQTPQPQPVQTPMQTRRFPMRAPGMPALPQ